MTTKELKQELISMLKTDTTLLGEMSRRTETVMKLRFGLDDGKERKQKEVAQELQISVQRVYLMESKAFERLKAIRRAREQPQNSEDTLKGKLEDVKEVIRKEAIKLLNRTDLTPLQKGEAFIKLLTFTDLPSYVIIPLKRKRILGGYVTPTIEEIILRDGLLRIVGIGRRGLNDIKETFLIDLKENIDFNQFKTT